MNTPIAPAPAATTTPPPLERWCPKGLLDLIRQAPTNPTLRGRIRNELHLVVPTTLFSESPSASGIESYLETHYAESSVGRAAEVAETARLVREAEQNRTRAVEARHYIVRNRDGSITVNNVTGAGEEVGAANFTCRFRASSARIIVPVETVEQGPAVIAAYIKSKLIDQEGDTDDYRYTDLVRRDVNLTDFSMNEAVLRLALSTE